MLVGIAPRTSGPGRATRKNALDSPIGVNWPGLGAIIRVNHALSIPLDARCGFGPARPTLLIQRRYEVARQKRNVMDKSHVVGLGRAVARSDAEGAAHPTHPATKRAAAVNRVVLPHVCRYTTQHPRTV